MQAPWPWPVERRARIGGLLSGRGSEETRELRERAKDLDFVQSRWHSFASNVVAKRYEDWICVLEPHKDGVWHLHVVVSTKADIRTGTRLCRAILERQHGVHDILPCSLRQGRVGVLQIDLGDLQIHGRLPRGLILGVQQGDGLGLLE